MSTNKNDPKFKRSFERGVLRAAFRSLFWAIVSERKKRAEGYTLSELAKDTSTSKHEVSRWFNGDPNWTINTIANIADAMDVDIRIEAVDRKTAEVFTPAGLQNPQANKVKLMPTSGATETDAPRPIRFIRTPFSEPLKTASVG
jgi:transcriptional regulator with XRE-family HTH domain